MDSGCNGPIATMNLERSFTGTDLLDIRVVPGMTLPADLEAKIAIRSKDGVKEY